uniref:Uncharacterized protein n=1 Tax=Aegilops tauschii subsp. strangulata TaxID=200361 RepID=A0A453FLY3_AEGTS
MPLSRASTRGRYRRIVGVTPALFFAPCSHRRHCPPVPLPSASSPPSLLSHQAPSAVQDAAGVLGFSSSRRRANGSRRGSTRTSSAAADARRETVDGDCAVRRRRGLRSTRGSTPTGSSSPIQMETGASRAPMPPSSWPCPASPSRTSSRSVNRPPIPRDAIAKWGLPSPSMPPPRHVPRL